MVHFPRTQSTCRARGSSALQLDAGLRVRADTGVSVVARPCGVHGALGHQLGLGLGSWCLRTWFWSPKALLSIVTPSFSPTKRHPSTPPPSEALTRSSTHVFTTASFTASPWRLACGANRFLVREVSPLTSSLVSENLARNDEMSCV